MTPQPPQLLPSTFSSTQTLPQLLSGIGQPQLPAMQASEPGQATPQPPQLFGSLLTKMHWPAQNVWPVGQLMPAPLGQPGRSASAIATKARTERRPGIMIPPKSRSIVTDATRPVKNT